MVHFEAPAEPQRFELPAAIEVAVYRIAQEALNNVVKHARATSCWIKLTIQTSPSGDLTRPAGQLLKLEVSDDGIGIPPNRPKRVGMASMRERAEELGGSLEVEPRIENGTRVVALIPIPRTLLTNLKSEKSKTIIEPVEPR